MNFTPFMIAALLSTAASAAQPPAPAPDPAPEPARPPVAAPPSLGTRTCVRDLRRDAGSRPAATRPQRLGELPPGDLQLTVSRVFDGCYEPTIVRQGFGAVGDLARR